MFNARMAEFEGSDLVSAKTMSDSVTSSVLRSLGIDSQTILYSPLLALFLLMVMTRLLSTYGSSKTHPTGSKKVPMVPYFIPVIGHSMSFLLNPFVFMSRLRDQSQHGIFALNMGACTLNVVSNPHLVKDLMSQKESSLPFQPIAWTVIQRFFALPKNTKERYREHWEKLDSATTYLMREPYLSAMMSNLARGLERNVPSMISFLESEIDLQPWERFAKTTYVSSTEAEADLMSLTRDMLGYVTVPAIFGSELLQRYPDLLQNVYIVDGAMNSFLTGIPAWFPWPGVLKAHIARHDLRHCLNEHQRALDAHAEGRPTSWNLDDVSDFIWRRHELFRACGFAVEERGDLSILWALIVNANLLVYWQILFILSTPGLVARIRKEVAPYATVSEGISIGKISEAPQLKVLPKDLSLHCPLLRSTYLESLRLVDQPWSFREVAKDVEVSDKKDPTTPRFILEKGTYLTIPHELHMRDPKHFKHPESFDPERFLVESDDGSHSVEIGSIRPYGGGPSMCKGRIYAERECLALVASVLMCWDIEPADPELGWAIPKLQKTTAVSRPVHDTRVRIKRRKFEGQG